MKALAIADVLNALQEHDADLVDIIREMRQATDEGKLFNPDRLLDKIAFIGPAVGLDALVQSITVKITDRLGVAWDEWYGLLLKYRQREGHCNVPATHKEGELTLGSWVSNQRTNKDDLSPERRERLEAIGFVWDGQAAAWEAGFAALTRFQQREGHCVVPKSHKEGDLRLGIWVGTQRKNKEDLSPARLERLEAIGFVWDGRLPSTPGD